MGYIFANFLLQPLPVRRILKYKNKNDSLRSIPNKVMPSTTSHAIFLPLIPGLFSTALPGHLSRFSELSLVSQLGGESSGILPSYSSRGGERSQRRGKVR